MTRITTWLFAAIFMLTFSSNVLASHEVMKWRDNRNAAVSVSFDDGYGSQITTAVPLLNAHNFKGTFYVITESVFWEVGASWDQWQDVAAQGHEIGSHTITHPALTTLPESEMRVELGDSQVLINQNIPAQNCLTLAYPYGDNNDIVQQITSEYYIAGRDVWSSDYLNYYTDGPYVPINFYAIGSLEFEYASQEEVLSIVDLAEERNAWFDTFLHDISNENLIQRFADFLDNISTRNVWVDTTGNIVRYMNERIESTVNVISETDTEIQLELTHTLDNSIYNIPVTMRSTVPSSWNEVEVRQGGLVVDTATAAMETSEAVIYYDVTPNAGLVTLSPLSLSSVISLNPVSLSATSLQGAVVPDQTFTVSNIGSGTLNYTITDDADWLSVNPASGVSAGELDTITVSFPTASLLTPAVYTASITATDVNATNSPQIIPVTLTIADPSGPNVTVVTPAEYQVAKLNVSDLYLLDRTYTLTSIPDDIGAGTAEWIKPLNDDKVVTSENHLTFSINQPSTVYVAYDSRATSVPNWLATTFTPTAMTVGVSESMGHFAVYEQNFTPGSITLGGNRAPGESGSGTNYVVAVKSLGPLVEQCNNAVDDDLDTLIDCGDPDCAASPLCSMPTIDLIPTALSATSVQGLAVSDQTFTVANTGTGTLNYTITDDADWLDVSPANGDSTGELDIITVSFPTASLLTPAVYTASITVTDANATNSPQIILVTLTIIEEPKPLISLIPVSLTATSVQGLAVPDQTFTVSNIGVGTLNYTITDDADWLSVNPASGDSTVEQDIITVSFPTAASLTPAVYTASITVTDANATNSPQIIPVTLTITEEPKPQISLAPVALSATSPQGAVAPDQTFTVANTGGGILNYIITDDADWLSVNPASGDSAGEVDIITVSFPTASLLTPAVYMASITVTDANALNSPQVIPVTLTITDVTGPNVTVVTPVDYQVAKLNVGDMYLLDRTYTLTSIPDEIGAGTAEWIMPFNNDKVVTSENHLTFTINKPSTVYVAYDSRATSVPNWLSGTFTPTALMIGVSESMGHFAVYEQNFTPGSITLGGNRAAGEEGAGTNYVVAVKSLGPLVEQCNNAVDDDLDTLIDCDDPDCAASPLCSSPIIDLLPTALASSSVQGLVVPDQTFTVANIGAGTLNYTITDDADWLNVSPASGDSVGELDIITVSYPTAESLPLGTYTASITVTDATALNSPQVIPVTLTITEEPKPLILLAPVALSATSPQNAVVPDQTLTITNIGVGTLNYTITDNADWLSVSPVSGDSTVEQDIITVSFPTAASLTPAVYTASITVTDANATNSPQIIPVTLTITEVTGPNVTIVSPVDYQVAKLNVGDMYLLDRTYTLTSIPAEIVAGTAEWIMPFNNDKVVTSENHLTFSINQPSTVYVAYDSRATSVPDWLSSAFTLTSLNVGVSEEMGQFVVYQQTFTPGTVTLGGNRAAGAEGAGTNYIVIVQP